MPGSSVPRSVRLEELFRRLRARPPMNGHDEARRCIEETLNAIEDEFSGVPFDPSSWRTDGRMYPVQDDSAGDVEGYPEVTSYRSRKHETLIRTNGAYEIRDPRTKEVAISALGADGKGVWS